MNFNLALICTDGSFADAGALCASCFSLCRMWEESSPSLGLRSPGGSHQPLLVQRHQPRTSNHSPDWRDQRYLEDGQEF